MIEGESIVITASILASQGRMDIMKVAYLTFIGTLFADQFLFFVGRVWGPSLLHRFPTFAKRSVRVLEFLRRYNTTYILVFRFIYGIRTISPIVIGIAGTRVKRFVILNFLSALIWTSVSCAAGYLIGETVISAFRQTEKFIKLIAIIIAVALISWALKRVIQLYLRDKE